MQIDFFLVRGDYIYNSCSFADYYYLFSQSLANKLSL